MSRPPDKQDDPVPILPMDAEPDEALKERVIALMRGGLGKAEIEFVSSITAPLFWGLRASPNDHIKNGSVFFLDAGSGLFAVTAAHVVQECFEDTKSSAFVGCFIGCHEGGQTVSVPLGDRLIDAHAGIDIATFRVTAEEVARSGHTILTGYQKAWPPRLPEVDRGVTYSGYPGVARMLLSPRDISFGCVAAGGLATSVSETSISILIERENLILVFGDRMPGENFDFGGISGGPVLAIVQTLTLRSWMPAGVIVQGPNPSGDETQSISGFDMIKGRPIQYILPDGHLDVARWEMNNIR